MVSKEGIPRAPVAGVAIGPETRARLPEAVTEPLGPLSLKGRAEPVEAHVLLSLDDTSASPAATSAG